MDKTLKASPRRSLTAAATVVLATFTFSAHAASSSIYKCVGKDGGQVYTDQPCKGGAVLDIHPGDVDPEAVARLQSARDSLDRAAAARIAEEQRQAARRDLEAMAQRQREEERVAAETQYNNDYVSPYDSYLGWYPGTGLVRPRPPRPRPLPTPAPRGFAPNPPFVVPRS
jgi:hypothetical protein